MKRMTKSHKTDTASRWGELTGLERLVLRYRLATNVLLHLILFTAALLLAYLLWFDAGPVNEQLHNWFRVSFLPCLPFFLGVKLIIFGRMRLFRGGWQYASIRDVANILLASWLFVLVAFVMIVLFYRLPAWTGRYLPILGPYFGLFPKGVLVLDFIGTVFLVCTARLGYRLYREELRPVSADGLKRVLMVGAGNAAETILREINRMRIERYRVVGLVDDDPDKKGICIHGVPVLGTTADLPRICEDKRIDEIIIAMPSATQKQLRRVIELCSGTKLRFQSLPGLSDLIDRRVTVSQIRPVDINDLLGRQAVELDADAVGRFLRGRRVLITGAGGSIGSEMCRQILAYRPERIILVEQAENNLFEIENELRAACGQVLVNACLCDILDRRRVLQIWQRYRPHVVVHAAAHKHVPIIERNPTEAVKNNILGTQNVADASAATGVAQFVLISTDKAVNPSSIMGASKRVAEIYTQALYARGECQTEFMAVRFGNVLGSAGSVVPTFRRQIAAGGPVRVTHPEMTRYFMTIPEASQLVLQAAATGAGGQIFLLDMGEPVKIVDLARQMITLSGFRPKEDIDIVFTGIRPGEKLFEELRTEGEDIEPTVHPKVRVWKCKPTPWQHVQEALAELTDLADKATREQIIESIQRLVPEFRPLNPPEESPLPPQPVGEWKQPVLAEGKVTA